MTKLLLILLIVLVIFGAGKLPKVMGDVAKGIKAFRDGMKDDEPAKQVTAEMQVPVKEPKE